MYIISHWVHVSLAQNNFTFLAYIIRSDTLLMQESQELPSEVIICDLWKEEQTVSQY